jgi:hypothetical protein
VPSQVHQLTPISAETAASSNDDELTHSFKDGYLAAGNREDNEDDAMDETPDSASCVVTGGATPGAPSPCFSSPAMLDLMPHFSFSATVNEIDKFILTTRRKSGIQTEKSDLALWEVSERACEVVSSTLIAPLTPALACSRDSVGDRP